MTQQSDVTLTGKKVIVVEDDPLLHSLISDKLAQLREKGVEVYPATNAEEGLAKAREVKPDLVLLDLVLPGMNGFEFLEQLRADASVAKTPVVVLSNLSDEGDKKRAKDLGVVAHLVKAEFSLTEITSVVEELLEGKALGNHEGKAPDIEKTDRGYMIRL